jgi:hypothetical protein
MTRRRRLVPQILSGRSDANIPFSELCGLLEDLGFQQRVRGSHHIFTMDSVVEILNLQPKVGKAKPYQVKQVRGILIRYKLGDDP